jgi:20S proteasome alpha/beta subunit
MSESGTSIQIVFLFRSLRLRDETRVSVITEKISSAAGAADAARGAVLACAQSANAMIASYDTSEGPTMYAVGGTAPPHRVEKYGAAGCGAALCTPVMDEHYRPGMTVKEAVAIVDRCIKQVRRIGLASFVIMVVDKDGAREYARRIVKPKADMEKKT